MQQKEEEKRQEHESRRLSCSSPARPPHHASMLCILPQFSVDCCFGHLRLRIFQELCRASRVAPTSGWTTLTVIRLQQTRHVLTPLRPKSGGKPEHQTMPYYNAMGLCFEGNIVWGWSKRKTRNGNRANCSFCLGMCKKKDSPKNVVFFWCPFLATTGSQAARNDKRPDFHSTNVTNRVPSPTQKSKPTAPSAKKMPTPNEQHSL